MRLALAIAGGGALGSLARHMVNIIATRALSGDFPWGTLAVNIIGSLVMGLLISFFALVWEPPQVIRALLTVGFLGGFTTFSAFSLDTVTMLQRGDTAPALLYVFASLLVPVLSLYGGMVLVRLMAPG